MRDLTNRKQVEKLEKAARVRDRQDGVTTRQLMSTMAGRQWMLRKLEAAHIFATSFSTNALQMSFSEGERNRGLDLLNDIMAYCPDEYVLMMREKNERDASVERSLSPDTDGGDQGSDTAADSNADTDA